MSFKGCESSKLTYPSTTGTSQITQIYSNGYSLSSGHNIVYGSCSNIASSNLAVGDFISYNGYMVNN